MRTKTYHYTAFSGKGKLVNLFGDESKYTDIIATNTKSIKFKDIDFNILLGASEYFEELRFDILKQKYPSLNSKLEFLTSDNFLGNSNLEIIYSTDKLKGRDLFLALKKAFVSISSHITSLKQEFVGSTEFTPRMLKDVLKDKKIYMEKIDSNGGKGVSQTYCSKEEYKLDLSNESWYAFNDNYGTSEEKLFIKYFKTSIEPKLKEKNLEYYVVRNERIPELAIYSFEAGERFEPDFLLFVRKKQVDGHLTYQGYIEPKGTHLLIQDAWKEHFSLEIKDMATTAGVMASDYKLIGLPFFNKENKMEEFEFSFNNWIENLG